MNFFKELVVASSLFSVFCQQASAHSWYPRDCCSESDCSPADRLFVDARGDMIVIAGMSRLIVPHGFPTRASPDQRIHVCFSRSRTEDVTPIYCIFVPGQS